MLPTREICHSGGILWRRIQLRRQGVDDPRVIVGWSANRLPASGRVEAEPSAATMGLERQPGVAEFVGCGRERTAYAPNCPGNPAELRRAHPL